MSPTRWLSIFTISIPAPARGATGPAGSVGRFAIIFQFPPLREGRPSGVTYAVCSLKFQFPPLREGRRGATVKIDDIIHFNSRPCARGDKYEIEKIKNIYYFNSRPCARGDVPHQESDNNYSISIPAPARGATYRVARFYW